MPSQTAPAFSATPVPHRDRVSLVAVGELDLSSAPRLTHELHQLLEVGWRDVTIDLREIDFMDTAGIHALLEFRTSAAQAGAVLGVTAVPGPVVDLLELTGTDALLLTR